MFSAARSTGSIPTMSTPLVEQREQQLEAWKRFLRAHAALTRQLSADLVAEHGLTINDYEVLLHLSRAEEQRLRRVDLAERVILTASGITRLLEGLERGGYVERDSCPSDRRVVYAKLTDAGLDKLREASRTHLAAWTSSSSSATRTRSERRSPSCSAASRRPARTPTARKRTRS